MIDDLIPENQGNPGVALLPYWNGEFHDFSALFVEIWATFLFTSVFLCVTHNSTSPTKIGAVNGILVCIGLWVGINIALKASSAGLNPAVGIALNVCSKFFYDNEDSLGKVWIYLAGPWIGAILSGAFYAFVHHPMCAPLTTPNFDDEEDVGHTDIEVPKHGHHIPTLGTHS